MFPTPRVKYHKHTKTELTSYTNRLASVQQKQYHYYITI